MSQVDSARLPPIIQAVYRIVGLLNLKGVYLPPSCTGGYYFTNEATVLSFAFGLWLVAVAVGAARHRCGLRDRATRLVARIAMIAAVYLHPTASSTALSLLNCQTVGLSGSNIAALEGGDPAAAQSSALSPVLLLASGEDASTLLRFSLNPAPISALDVIPALQTHTSFAFVALIFLSESWLPLHSPSTWLGFRY